MAVGKGLGLFILVGGGLMLLGCGRQEGSPPPQAVSSASEPPSEIARPVVPEPPSEAPAVDTAQETDPEPEKEPEPPPRLWGKADVDPSNDGVVAPPDEVPDCQQRLKDAGIEFKPAKLPLKQLRNDIPTCGAHDAVTVIRAPGGLKLSPPAVMSCQLALAMVGFEELVQKHAQAELGKKVKSVRQGGTYNCRKMARFNLVSEHSYGNAIDIYSFTLEDGQKVSVVSHYGKTTEEPKTDRARFLRNLASATYDEKIFSVSLTPFWDALHRDHFHFDMARYRVDGTR